MIACGGGCWGILSLCQKLVSAFYGFVSFVYFLKLDDAGLAGFPAKERASHGRGCCSSGSWRGWEMCTTIRDDDDGVVEDEDDGLMD